MEEEIGAISIHTNFAPVLNFIDVAFENLPETLKNRIVNLISELELESRGDIEGQFKTFIEICRSSKTPQILIIKGEWGEGKTTIFEIYMKNVERDYPEEFINYKTRMDRVLDIFEKKVTGYVRVSTAEVFLASLLEDIFLKLKEEGDPLAYSLRELQEISSREDIHNAIKLLSNKKKHIIFFIDEFEAIMGRKSTSPSQIDTVKAIIRAIRDIRGGELKSLVENTKIIPHFIFAMTPYAYSEYVHLLGPEYKGWEQRRRYLIELEPLTRKDIELVIKQLIKKVYFNKSVEIEDLFENKRYLEILFTVSQGNFGALIQAFNLLLATARRKHKELFGKEGIVKINADLIIETFTQHKIYTYVGESEGIDRQLYFDIAEFIKRHLKEDIYLSLWKELVASSGILLESEINEPDLILLNKALYDRLQRDAIVEVYLYPISSSLEDKLVEILKRDNASIEDSKLRISLRRIFVSIDGKRYLPLPPYDDSMRRHLSSVLSRMLSFSTIITITPNTLRQLYNTLKEYSEQVPRGYTLSQHLKERLYPAPPIFVIDFISPHMALQLWKRAYDDITKDIRKAERNIMVFIINNILPLYEKIKKVGVDARSNRPFLRYRYGDHEIILRFDVLVSLLFDENIVSYIQQTLESGRIPIIVAKDSVYSELLRKLKEMNINKRTILLSVPEIKLIQLSIIQEILFKKNRREMDESSIDYQKLNSKLLELANSLGIDKEIDTLLDRLREEGYLIEDLKKVGKNVDSFLNAYFMLLYGGSEFTIEELWENHLTKLSETLLYGRGVRKPVVLKLDIETPNSLSEFIEPLEENGFISQKEDGTIKIRTSKVENRIIEILKEYKDQGQDEVKVDDVKLHFIEISRAKYDIFKDVYLTILEWKGIIEIKNGFIKIIELGYLDKKLKKLYNDFLKKKAHIMNSMRVKENPDIAHIAMFKKKGELIIKIEQLDEIIRSYVSAPAIYKLTNAQKRLLIDYIDYVNNVLLEKIEWSIDHIEDISTQISNKISNLYDNIDSIARFLGTLDPNFEVSLISEINILAKFRSKLDEILELKEPKLSQEIKREYSETKAKGKRELELHPMFFKEETHNYILYQLIKLRDDIDRYGRYLQREYIKRIQKVINEIIESQHTIKRLRNEIESIAKEYNLHVQIPEINVKNEYRAQLSLSEIYFNLKGYLENILKRHVEELEKVRKSTKSLVGEYQNLMKVIENLNRATKKVKTKLRTFSKFLREIHETELSIPIHINTVDIRNLEKELSEITQKLDTATDNLGRIFSEEEYIKRIRESLEDIKEDIERINGQLEDNIRNMRASITQRISEGESIISLLKKFQRQSSIELPDSLVLQYKEAEKIIGEIKVKLETNEFLDNGVIIFEEIRDLSQKINQTKKEFAVLEMNNPQIAIFKLLLENSNITLNDIISRLSGKFPEETIINTLLTLERNGYIKSYISFR